MGRSKPNKPSKSSHKAHNKQTKENKTQSEIPHAARATTKPIETETETTKESTEKRDRTHKKYVRNPEDHPYHEGDKIYRRRDREDRHSEQFDEDHQVIDLSNKGFEQPLDEDAQGKIASMRRMDIDREDDIKQTPNKEDAKPAAEEQEQASPSPEIKDRRSRKQDDETKKMKKLFAVFTANTQKQLNKQAERHAIEIDAMKQTSMETQNLLTTKTMSIQPVNNHRASVHFTAMNKVCDVLFERQPEKLARV
jgi:hypothetical protein